MKHDQCRWCTREFAKDETIACIQCADFPVFLQLQADPFPSELQYVADDKAIAEQGFIEQDASAPIKEQTSWLRAENDSLRVRLAAAMGQLKEAREQNSELARKAKLYDGYIAILAECMHDLKG